MNSSTVQSPTMMLTRQTHASELCGNLVDRISFDDVPGLNIVKILDADSAFIPLLYFTDIVLEATQRAKLPFIDHDVVTNHSDADSRSGNRAVHDIGPRNNAGFGHCEDLSNFGSSQRPLLERRLKQ